MCFKSHFSKELKKILILSQFCFCSFSQLTLKQHVFLISHDRYFFLRRLESPKHSIHLSEESALPKSFPWFKCCQDGFSHPKHISNLLALCPVSALGFAVTPSICSCSNVKTISRPSSQQAGPLLSRHCGLLTPLR